MKGNFSASGSTNWYLVDGGAGIHAAARGSFGAGTVTVEQYIGGDASAMVDDASTELSYTEAFDALLDVRKGDIVRLTLSEATSPDLNWVMNGDIRPVDVA